LPLRFIVDELGGEIELLDNSVSVIRAQDGVKISLNFNSGVVKVNAKPVGIAPNIAYANIDELLLPREAVASLTGTHITIPSGSRRIDVDVDDELSRIIRPGDSIRSSINANSGKVESVRVLYDSDHKLDTDVKGHYKEYSLRMDYHSPSTQGEGRFTPDWLKITAESVDGWILSAGDQVIKHRELDGVNVSRLNGASYYRPMSNGVLVGVAGKPQSGTKELGNGQRISTFGGKAAGLRYYNNKRDFEYGMALRDNQDLNFKGLVLSAHKSLNRPDFRLGNVHQRIDGALGTYDVNGQRDIGGRFSWDARLEPSEALSLSARADYSSSEVITGFEQKKAVNYTARIADLSVYGATLNYRPWRRLSFTMTHNETRRGLFEGELTDKMLKWQKKSAAGVSFSTISHRLSPWIHFNWSRSENNEKERVKRLSGQAVWNLNAYHLLLKHEHQKSNVRGKSWLSSLELSRDSMIRYFSKNSRILLSPRLSAWKGTELQSGSIGALASFESGQLLGEQIDFKMSYGKNLGVHRIETQADLDAQTETLENEYFSVHLGIGFNNLLAFNANYYSNLAGSDDIYASLSAFYEFNAPRQIKKTQKNSGILMGQVFFDKNHDGRQQKDEQGIGGVKVSIKGTRVALNADRRGHFTIQNLPVGIYRITPDVSRLPLGFVRQAESETPVQIGDARITTIKIPIVEGSRVSGVVYVDENGNQKVDKGEPRIENIGLELSSGEETASTLFGQFTFDFLPPDNYVLKVQDDTLSNEYEIDPTMKWGIELSSGEKSIINVRLLKKSGIF